MHAVGFGLLPQVLERTCCSLGAGEQLALQQQRVKTDSPQERWLRVPCGAALLDGVPPWLALGMGPALVVLAEGSVLD